MAEEIERTIYKLELDDSDYIRGVESLSASTKKLTAEQDRANKALQVSQTILKQQSDYFQQTKKDLDSYTGTNEKYRLQLTKTFSTAEADNLKLTEEVLKNQKAYEAATKAAQDFANTSAKASNLQQQTTGGKIPTGPPPGISASITAQISGVLNVADFTKQAQIIEQTKNEFNDLGVSVSIAEARMKQLNSTDEEFKLLAPLVAQGKEALTQYGIATGQAQEKTARLRTEILNGTDALIKMRQAGQEGSKEFTDLQNHVAKLTEEYREQRNTIKVLSSETRAIDFGKSAVQAAIAGFEVYTSVSILAGGASEELQHKSMQLFAAMQLLNSLEELSVSLKKGSIIATNLQSTAQAVYTGVVGASTGALKAFKLALLGTGIGAAIVLIGFLVSKWLAYRDVVKKAGENQKVLNDIISEGHKDASKEVVDLKILYDATQNVALSTETRTKAAKELQELYPQTFANFTKENILLGDAKTAYDKLTESIYANARAAAGKAKIQELTAKSLDIETSLQNAQDDFDRANLEFNLEVKKDTKEGAEVLSEQYKKYTTITREGFASIRDEKVRGLKEDLAENKAQQDAIVRLVGATNLVDTVVKPDKPEKDKKEKAKKEIQDDFEARKATLLEEIAKLSEVELQNEVNVRKVFDEKLNKALISIDKDKGLKPEERKQLVNLTVDLNTQELNKALADLSKKQLDARAKLNEELRNLQDKNALDQLNLLQDEFDRRAKLIDFNEQKELDAAKESTQKRLDSLDLQRLLIGEDAYQKAKAILITEGEQAALNIIQKFAGERQTLAVDTFERLLNAYNDAISNADLVRDEDQAKQLAAAKEGFLTHKLTYQQFLDEIKRIKDSHDKDMAEGDLIVLKDQLAELDRKIAATKDKTTKGYADLIKQQKEFRKVIAAKESEAATDVPPPPKVEDKSDNFTARVQAMGELADSVISFWQKTNEAEAAALDRSIALQEKRISAAQKIAERGNAQYLKAEEDRLTELNIKRENAARKQLGIDAALQGSQILVGITGAIAKIATPGIGIAETIGAIAIIVGALATGYSLVKSLQGNQPKLAEGTTELKRGKHPAGRDTIPAWLDEGEAVLPTETNKKYKKTVEAIYHGKVPADVMNEFVENYVRNNTTKNQKTENKTESTYQKFVQNISKIPTKVLNNFINNYEKKEVKKYFKGTTDAKATGETSIPAWLSQGEPAKAKNFTETKEAIYQGKIPATVISQFAEKYLKDEKKNIERKDLTSIIRRVLSENNIKNISDTEINSFINSYKNEKASSLTQSVFKLVNEKIDSQLLKSSQYSDVLNKVFSENKRLVEDKKVVDLVHKSVNLISDEKITKSQVKDFITKDSFVNNYTKNESERKAFNVAENLIKIVDQKLNKTENVLTDDVLKYSTITDTILSENKSLVESKNINSLVAKAYNALFETKQFKNVSSNSLSSFIDSYTLDLKEKRESSAIEKVFNQVTGKLENIKSDVEKTEKNKGLYESREVIESETGSRTSFMEIEKALSETSDKKYLSVIDKVFSENKELVESKKIAGIIQKVIKESSAKDISETRISNFLNTGAREDKETSSLIKSVSSLVNNKFDSRYSDVVDKIFSENKNLVESKNVSGLIHKVLSESDQKDISLKQVSSVVKEASDRKQKSVIETIASLVNNKVENSDIRQNEKATSQISQISDNKISSDFHQAEATEKTQKEISNVQQTLTDSRAGTLTNEASYVTNEVKSLTDTLHQSLTNKNVSLSDVQHYSNLVDKVISENRDFAEAKNTTAIVHKAVNELSGKEYSRSEIVSVINNQKKEAEEKKTASVIQTVVKLAQEKVEKENISSDLQNKLVNEHVSISDIQKYSNVVNKIADEKKAQDSRSIIENKAIYKNLSESEKVYQNFVQNVAQVPAKVLNNFINNYEKSDKKVSREETKEVVSSLSTAQSKPSQEVVTKFIENYEKENKTKVSASVLNNFINNYQERKFFRGTTELTGPPGIDKIPIWATKGEAIIPPGINNLYKPVINAVFKRTIPPEHLNNFVNNYHQIKQVPQVNYERIKDAAELKISSDGRMSVAIAEQNKLIVENNDLQRQTLRAMKSMAVSATINKDGVAIMVNEFISKMEIDKKV